MAISDTVADMLTKIRNALGAGHKVVRVPHSGLKIAVLQVLKNEGFIKDFRIKKEGIPHLIDCTLKYDSKAKPVIHEITRISKPGRRVYARYCNMERVRNGFGIYVVSTSAGVISDKQARDKKVGGELICSVW